MKKITLEGDYYLDTVEDGTHDPGAELDRQRLSAAQHGVAHGKPRGVLVHLTGKINKAKQEPEKTGERGPGNVSTGSHAKSGQDE